jgi:hypothetical protein
LSLATFAVTAILTGTVLAVALCCASDDGVVTNIATVVNAESSKSMIRVFMANLLVIFVDIREWISVSRSPGRTPATGLVRPGIA